MVWKICLLGYKDMDLVRDVHAIFVIVGAENINI